MAGTDDSSSDLVALAKQVLCRNLTKDVTKIREDFDNNYEGESRSDFQSPSD